MVSYQELSKKEIITLLKKANEELSLIMDASPNVIHILDGNGKSLDISRSCNNIEGMSREEILQKNIYQLVEEGVYDRTAAIEVIKKRKPATILQHTMAGKEVLVMAKPFWSKGRIHRIICNSWDISALKSIETNLKRISDNIQKFEKINKASPGCHNEIAGFIVRDARMQKLLSNVLNIARVDVSVLITGETGTGKEEISRIIHKNSKRSNGPFIKLNCGAIPESLLESELFGYEPCAFTDASRLGKKGLLELSNNGTLFLDEVGELPKSLQVKLLRVLQDGCFYRVGGQEPVFVNFRLISAANSSLEKCIEQGSFREDLYYRLNVVPILIPPLRERRDDIRELVDHFCKVYNKKHNFKKVINPGIIDQFEKYRWPGNVRELQNLVERLIVSTVDDQIGPTSLPGQFSPSLQKFSGKKPHTLKELMGEFEKTTIQRLLNQDIPLNTLAEDLGIDRSTLFRKIKKHGLEIRRQDI